MHLATNDLLNTLFLKITTTPLHTTLASLPAPVREGVEVRLAYNQAPENTHLAPPAFDEQAQLALLPELSRVSTVTVGMVKYEEEQFVPYTKTYGAAAEAELLAKVGNVLLKNREQRGHYLVGGYQVRTFDVPFLVKRFVINGLPLPQALRLHGRKPWDSGLLDVSDNWTNGELRQSVSFPVFAHAFGVDPATFVGQPEYELRALMELAVKLRDLG
jgi:hypothetical protein